MRESCSSVRGCASGSDLAAASTSSSLMAWSRARSAAVIPYLSRIGRRFLRSGALLEIDDLLTLACLSSRNDTDQLTARRVNDHQHGARCDADPARALL